MALGARQCEVDTFVKLSIRPPDWNYWLRRDDLDFVALRVAKPGDARAFAERFGGERLISSSGQRRS
jgi:hypothetical protein